MQLALLTPQAGAVAVAPRRQARRAPASRWPMVAVSAAASADDASTSRRNVVASLLLGLAPLLVANDAHAIGKDFRQALRE